MRTPEKEDVPDRIRCPQREQAGGSEHQWPGGHEQEEGQRTWRLEGEQGRPGGAGQTRCGQVWLDAPAVMGSRK